MSISLSNNALSHSKPEIVKTTAKVSHASAQEQSGAS